MRASLLVSLDKRPHVERSGERRLGGGRQVNLPGLLSRERLRSAGIGLWRCGRNFARGDPVPTAPTSDPFGSSRACYPTSWVRCAGKRKCLF